MVTKTMFLDEYVFRGSQGDKVVALTSLIDKESNTSIFSSLVELFVTAAVVGCYFEHQEEPEKGDIVKKIFPQQFKNHTKQLNLVLRLVLLVGEKEKVSTMDRLNRTFRNRETDENYQLLEKYVLGGISELYDIFIGNKNTHFEDYLVSLSKFVNDFVDQNMDELIDEPSTEDIF